MAKERARGGAASTTENPPTRRQRRSGARDPKPGAAVKPKSAEQTATAAASNVQPKRAERRPELVKQRRQERQQQYQRQQRQWLMTKIGFGVVAAVVVIALGYGGYSWVEDRNNRRVPDGVVEYGYPDVSDHTSDPVTYTEVPPVGGTHDGAWQNCAFYDRQVRNENAVHSLEHGAVWITYRQDLPQEQIDELREKAEQGFVLVSPFPNLPTPVVASAWNRQLQLDSVDDERLDQFIRAFRRGPQTPEPNASCSGGVSATIG